MELTDGHKTVLAMEFKPIPCLSTKLSPGCKILLTGPMRCINKIIFLEAKNVKILGGEVSKLEIENAYENVLLRKLGKPINPNPKTEYHEPAVILPADRVLPVPQLRADVQLNANDLFEDDELLLGIDLDSNLIENNALPAILSNNASKTSSNPVPERNQTSLKQSIIPNTDVAEHALPRNNQTVALRSTVVSSTVVDAFDPDIDNCFDIDEEEERIIYDDNIRRHQYNTERIADPSNITTTTNMPMTSSNISKPIDQQKDVIVIPSISILNKNYPHKIRGCHVATTAQLCSLENADERFDISFMVKCEIDSLCEKISLTKNSWTILVYLRDQSNQLLQVIILHIKKYQFDCTNPLMLYRLELWTMF